MKRKKTLKTRKKALKIRKDLFVWALVLVGMVAIAVGDIEPQVVGVDTGQEVYATDVDSNINEDVVLRQAGDPLAKRIQSITFKKDMRIRDALRFLALKYDKNIVPSAKVDGILAFTNLFDVTFEQAMDAILGRNLKYEQNGNLIKVYTNDEYKQVMEDKDRMVNRVFTLYYISAAEALKLVKPVLSTAGTIQGSSPAETVVPTGESISVGSGGGDSMALNDMIVLRDYPEKVAEAEALLKQLDVRPKQVLVEATILSAVLDEDTQFGIDWNLMAGVSLTGLGATSVTQDNVLGGILTESGATNTLEQIHGLTNGQPITTSGFTSNTGGLRLGVSMGNAAVLLTALEEVTDITIMANPKILAVNKQLGQVYIGTKLGYREGDTFDSTGNRVEGEVQFLETGTKLSFRPYIGEDGYIRMDIQPKDSSGVLSGGIPSETSAELATNIMVKDGQTIVIGGLFRDVVSTTKNQVPLLGDIPLIGALFRGTDDETQRQEVIVMLTPHIIENPSEINGDAAARDIDRKRIGAKDELQWIGRRRLAEDRYAKAAAHYLDGDNEAALTELKTVLELRPSYLEAIRLKERIIEETDPEAAEWMERKVLSTVGRQ